MKETYVLEQRTIKLEMDIVDLRKNVRNTTKVHDKGVQIEGQTFEIGETSSHTMEIDEENL